MDPQPTPVPLMPKLSLQLTMAVEILLMALFDGGLVVMGITCISLLTNGGRKIAHRRFWRAFVAVLIFLNISFLLESFLWTFSWIIYNSSPKKAQAVSFIVLYMSDITAAMMVCLTDGVLVSHEVRRSHTYTGLLMQPYHILRRCGDVTWSTKLFHLVIGN